jgi:DNA repair protein RadC
MRPRLLTAADAAALLGEEIRCASREYLRIVHLDQHGGVLALSSQRGGHNALPIAMHRIAREALLHDSRRLLIAHNHPSGDSTPSVADRRATRRLAEVMRLIEVDLVDHLVFSCNGVTSFRQLGLI